MNATLQAIEDKNQEFIRDKAKPNPDPEKVGASDLAEIVTDTLVAIDTITTALQPLPQGVEWVSPPGDPVFGTGTVTEEASVIKVNGTDRNVDEATLSQPAAATGMHRIDLTVIHYEPDTLLAEYELLQGDEAPTSETVFAPTIPANRFMVRQMLVGSGGVSVVPPSVVNSANINGQANVYPDLFGTLNLSVTAAQVPYTPSDAAWWASILTGGQTFLKNAMDYLQGAVKTLQADKANKTLSINTRTSNYTLALSDAGGMVRMNVATANTVTFPPVSSVAFPVGTQIVFSQAGAGQTTFQGGSGVTVNGYLGKVKSAGQYSGISAIMVSTDTWLLLGNTTL